MWVAVTTLLRAVGSVLHKVDAPTNPVLKKIIDTEWDILRSTKPEPAIFWQFIDCERNNVVKQYEFGFSRAAVYGPPLGQAGIQLRVNLLDVCVALPPQEFPAVESTIRTGAFEGQSEQDVAAQAVNWWDAQLDRILTLFDQQTAQ